MIERGKTTFQNTNTPKTFIYYKPNLNKHRKHCLELEREMRYQGDCGKKYEAIIIKTQNTTENTAPPKINNAWQQLAHTLMIT